MVQLIQWGPHLEVGYPAIDQEHHQLVTMMNQLLDSLLSGETSSTLATTFAGLLAYTETHFRHEQTLMAERGYPDAAAHLAEHESFRRQVAEFKAKYDAGDTMLTLGVMKFLRVWLTDHILTVDRSLAEFLKDN